LAVEAVVVVVEGRLGKITFLLVVAVERVDM
jgi:hypothetical protein